MSPSRISYPVSIETTPDSAAQIFPDSLAETLRPLVDDRSSAAADLVFQTTARLCVWVSRKSAAWSWDQSGTELEAGLAAWHAAQGWRGPCSTWLDSLRRTWHHGRDLSKTRANVLPRELLCEELALWYGAELARVDQADGSPIAPHHWNGEPLSEGCRVPSRTALAEHAARPVERGEVVLVSGFSDSVALALETAQRAGRRPHALVAEAAPRRDGRLMAQRLARSDIPVTLCYDAALPANLSRADRVWLATEAIGTDALLARVGTRHLVEEADRLEVPVYVLATSDKLMPGGELSLPRFCERDTSLLWDEAPAGVRLESQCYETVPLDELPRFVTEVGVETATALHLRALRIEAAPPCVPPAQARTRTP